MSALKGSQLWQAAPLEPHSLKLIWMQPPSEPQQPGQFVAEHGAQMPPLQRPVPHCTQVVPPVPQSETELPGMHEPLAQQPASHVVLLHAASEQPPSWQLPEGQAEQLPPEAPQLLGLVPGWQTPIESQHPLGHVMALQRADTQALSWQVPVPQAWQVIPFFPQAVSLLPPRQTPPWQQPTQLLALQALSHAWLVQEAVH